MRSSNKRRAWLMMIATVAMLMSSGAYARAQLPAPDWQTAAGSKMAFDVVSVRQNKTDEKPSMNVNPTFYDTFTPTGGVYSAKNVGLMSYIMFAYKLSMNQIIALESQMPGWAMTDHFDIEARAAGDPTKDQYRLMMQSLLADRFKLVAHHETQQVPKFAIELAKPAKLGPQLRMHRTDDPVCSAPPVKAVPGGFVPEDAEGFPLSCGSLTGMKPSTSGRMRWGGRDVPISLFASVLQGVSVIGRPMVDQTGIKGNVDFDLEWMKVAANMVNSENFHPDEDAPTFVEALKDQLGLKLVPVKGPVDIFVVDHVEHPSAN